MKNSVSILLIFSSLCWSCSKDRETVSGQKFTVVRAGDGKAIDSSRYMLINFLFKDGKDSVWNDTRKNGVPLIIQKRNISKSKDKVLEVIRMLSKGDSVVFKISAKELFNQPRQRLPPKVDSLSSFTFLAGVYDVLDSAQFSKFRTELIAKQNEKAMKQQQEQLGKDTVLIDNYLKGKKIKTLKTSSGLRYVVTKAGKGLNAVDGQTASVNYAGYLLNGAFFDTSIESVAKEKNLFQPGRPYKPYDVVVGRSQVIQGWHEALRLMNKGSKITVYIPSTLGYGNRRRDNLIVENSILVFDMELIDLK